MSKQTYYNIEKGYPKIHPKLSEWIARGNDDHHFSCKVCNNRSLKHWTLGLEAPRNNMKPNKDPKNKTKHKRNFAVNQKSFLIFSLVGKSSAAARQVKILKQW